MMGKNYSPKFIRFAAAVGPKIKPYAAKDKDGKDIYVYDAKLMPIIANYFGARYEIVTPTDGAYGASLPDGNWTGMIGMVKREESDLAMPVVMAEERFRAVNYSYPYRYSSLSFMTDAPQPMPKNLAIFYPFSYTMWIALVLLTIAMSFVFYVLLDRRQTYQRVLLSTVRSTLESSIDFKMHKPAVKMAAFTWILGMFVITNGYKAVLLSFLSFPKMVGIRDISQLSAAAMTGSFKCITFPGSSGEQDLIKSNNPSWKAIGECLLRNDNHGNPLENFAAAPHGKAFVGSKFLTTPYKRRFFVSEDNFFIEHHAIPFSKTFCCAEDLNRIIHRLVAAGIFEKVRKEEIFFMVLQTPSLTPEHSEVSHVIRLEDMSGAFYVLISGWFASFMALLIEICIQKCN